MDKRILQSGVILLIFLAFTGCDRRTYRGEGAAIGGVVGAGTGAAVGSQSGNAGTGAIIGGASGAVVGGAVGSTVNKETSTAEEDAMAEYQKKQIERQKRELDDIRRQKLYDDKYRRYESQHSR